MLVVDSPELVRRQAVRLGPGAGRALAVLGAMIVALVTGVVPAVVAGLVAAGAMVVLRVLTPTAAYRGISWTTVVLIAGMIPLATALTQTGAAQVIADGLVSVVGDLGPIALLAGMFVITATFGQLISNTATALIMIPIAVVAASEMGVSIRPVLMSLTVAASAAYLTPIATPVNMMVMGPGGYRFGDYWRLGLVMLLLTFVVAVLLVPRHLAVLSALIGGSGIEARIAMDDLAVDQGDQWPSRRKDGRIRCVGQGGCFDDHQIGALAAHEPAQILLSGRDRWIEARRAEGAGNIDGMGCAGLRRRVARTGRAAQAPRRCPATGRTARRARPFRRA